MDKAFAFGVIVLSAYHAMYCVYVKNWAIERAAKVSSIDYYKGTDRKEYERREVEYAKARDKLMMAKNQQHLNGNDILPLLGSIRDSILFNEAYRSEYDALWMACLNEDENLQESLKSLCVKMRT